MLEILHEAERQLFLANDNAFRLIHDAVMTYGKSASLFFYPFHAIKDEELSRMFCRWLDFCLDYRMRQHPIKLILDD